MTTSVKIDAIRASDVYAAWGNIGTETPKTVGIAGTDLLDGAALALLKSEWMAASAGVTPFIPLPGGGKGILSVGGALSAPATAWPQPEAQHLYMLAHRNIQGLHASIHAKRIGTPMLAVPNLLPSQAVSMWPAEDSGGHKYNALPAIPVAYVVIGAIGIIASMAGTYYATRTEEKRIEADADKAKEAHTIGTLSDLASQQLQKTGKIDPNIIAAIRTTPSSAFNAWPYVALGGGAIVLGSVATYKLMTYKKGRRR